LLNSCSVIDDNEVVSDEVLFYERWQIVSYLEEVGCGDGVFNLLLF